MASEVADESIPETLADFPENVLLHVFSFLNYEDLCMGARPVCKRWSRLTFDPTLWRYIEVPQHFSDKRFLALMHRVQKHVEELECSKCENLSDYVFTELSKLDLMKLKKLAMPIVSSCSDTQFIKLMGACDCLEDISNIRSNLQESCNPMYSQLIFPHVRVCYDKPISTYGRIRKIVPAFDQRKLDQWIGDLANFGRKRGEQIERYECIRGTDFLTDDGMETVSKMFPKLNRIDIRQCNFTDEGLKNFFKHNLSKGGLLEIEMDKPGNITDKGVKLIADNCPNLERIKIARAVKVSNEGVNYLLIRCPRLVSVHLNNNVALYEEPDPDKAEIDNTCLESAGTHCKWLESFRIFYTNAVDYIGVEKLVAGCRYLGSLMFFDCPSICDKALDAISKLRYLKAIVLVNCEKITPKGVIKLILVCTNLYRMTLYCNNVLFYADQSQLADETYELIDAAGAEYRPNVMRKLTLRGVGSGFTQLLTVLCPDLHTLDIREANYITNLALRSVMRNCELLRSLDVAALTLDEEFLQDLCRLAPNLRHLTLGQALRECERANEGLADIIRQCRSLSMIALNNPDYHINERFIIHVAKKYHGGRCVLHVDPDADEDVKHRFIDFHFTPIKYLGSINTVEYKDEYVDLPPKVPKVDDEDEDLPDIPAKKTEHAESPSGAAVAKDPTWVDLPMIEDSQVPTGDSKLRVAIDVPFLQNALEAVGVGQEAGETEAGSAKDGNNADDKAAVEPEVPVAEAQAGVPVPEVPVAEAPAVAPVPDPEEPDELSEMQARAEAAVAAATRGVLSPDKEIEVIADIVNYINLALDDSGRRGDRRTGGPSIDFRFLQSALDTAKRLTDNRATEVQPCSANNAPAAAPPAEAQAVETPPPSASNQTNGSVDQDPPPPPESSGPTPGSDRPACSSTTTDSPEESSTNSAENDQNGPAQPNGPSAPGESNADAPEQSDNAANDDSNQTNNGGSTSQ